MEGRTLSWRDVHERVVDVARDYFKLSIHWEIKLALGSSPLGTCSDGFREDSSREQLPAYEQGQDIISLPSDYSGFRQYVVSVCIRQR